MEPQYVAGRSSSTRAIEASESQRAMIPACGYLFASRSPKLSSRFTHVTYTSKGTGFRDFPANLPYNCDRRLRCPRASNCWPYSALHSQLPHVRVKHRLKSSLWLTPRRSPSSQHTQVSTSNLPLGQAFAPAPTRPCIRSGGAVSWR